MFLHRLRQQCGRFCGEYLQVCAFGVVLVNRTANFQENFRILKPGGIWVNLGPLLYHYSDVRFEGSIEPTYEDLVLIIRAVGFEILVRNTLACRSDAPFIHDLYMVVEKRNQRAHQVRPESQFDATKRIPQRVLCVPQTLECTRIGGLLRWWQQLHQWQRRRPFASGQ